MADEHNEHKSWWATLPGLLTASGTFLAGITGLLIALNQLGVLPVRTKETASLASPSVTQASTEKSSEGSTYVIWRMISVNGSWRLDYPDYPQTDPCVVSDTASKGSRSTAGKAMLKTVRDYYAAWNDQRLDDAWSLLSASFQDNNKATWKANHSFDRAIRDSSDCALPDQHVGLTVVSIPR